MTEEEIPDLNIFMMCQQLQTKALSHLKPEYYFRNIRPHELGIWKSFPFDSPELALEYEGFMSQYFEETYGKQPDLFFKNTFFACNQKDEPLATCSSWKAYGKFNTIQWFKILKTQEGIGIGRALFSLIMRSFEAADYPIYLHTQPGSFRAIKLYSDFGFSILSDEEVGGRPNDLEACLPILQKFMNQTDFEKLKITKAPADFIESLKAETSIQF
jgi:ribosomal protein S18 acetylase RimI-like enzyme